MHVVTRDIMVIRNNDDIWIERKRRRSDQVL